jgi:hypothetical protein
MATENRVQTKRMGNFDMASAADRILAFWEMYPNGKMQVIRSVDPTDNLKVFDTYIWKDKSTWLDAAKALPAGLDKETIESILLSSCDANAPAKQPEGKEAKKDFEKLDTISAGRALAKIGFLKDGQVASNEEMEEFNQYKKTKLEEETESALEYLNEAESLEDLAKRWVEIGGDVKKVKEVVEKKDLMKANFQNKARGEAEKAKKAAK